MRRIIYLASTALLVFIIVLSSVASELSGSSSLLNRSINGYLLAFYLTSFVLLWQKPAWLRPLEIVLITHGAVTTLAILALYQLTVEETLIRQHITVWFAVWSSLVYIWMFIILGSRRGLIAATLYFLGSVAVSAGPAYHEWQLYRDSFNLATFVQYYLVSICQVASLFAFAYFLERHTEARTVADSIARYAYLDVLTGLPNRLLLEDRLAQDIAFCKRNDTTLAVLFIDLDGFKTINDTHGHQGGDVLLQQLAERLKNSIRESDTAARISGDEFVIIIFDIKEEKYAERIADKLLANLRAPFTINGETVTVTASIGISLYPEDGGTVGDLLIQADKAMYRAKKRGKNRYRSYRQVMKETPAP